MKISAIEHLHAKGGKSVVISKPFFYKGLIEASAAATLDSEHFIVASDESNTLRLYRRNIEKPLAKFDLTAFTEAKKSDIEASATIGDLIYWIGSHSNKENETAGADKRSILFATTATGEGDTRSIQGFGTPFRKLRAAIEATTRIAMDILNIEGLTATPDGHLLIGLRSPLAENGSALVLPLENPLDVVTGAAAPHLGKAIELDLDGLGIRSIDRLDSPLATYLILAGPQTDKGKTFVLYGWNGADTPKKIADIDIKKFRGEALVTYPGSRLVQVLSDDGTDEKNDGNADKKDRRFRSVDILLPEA